MNKNATNPSTSSSSSSSSYDKIHSNVRLMKHNKYLKGGLPPIFLWSLGLTSIFSLFILYSPTPFLFSSRHDDDLHEHHPSTNTIPLIKPHKHFVDDEKCELSKGKWVPDSKISHYTSTSCKTIPDSKNCFKHGRKDTDFLNWRWKPQSCELPKFNPNKFLEIVRGKKLGFIGDSVARNHMESLLCQLSQAETPTDVYKDSEDRFRTWHFPSSNFTLMIFWSKFLVKSEERMVNNSGTGSFNLHLDKVDEKWASKLPILDYAIISAAHWFFRQNYLYDQGRLAGCVYCNEPNVTDLGLNYSLRMSIRGALKHINDCKDCKGGLVTLVRTFSPAHFENGAWNTGGTCNRTSPYSEERGKEKSYELELGELQVEELERARKNGLEPSWKRFRALDVTRAMLMRPDGHPGEHWGNKYMQGYNDCVHWCMPGPVDVWNDFLLAVIQKEVDFLDDRFHFSGKIQV